MSILRSTLVFASLVRIVTQAVSLGLAVPFVFLQRILPESSGVSFPRIAKVKRWLGEKVKAFAGQKTEYRGNGVFMVRYTSDLEWLDSVIDRMPERVYSIWGRYSIAVTTVFLLAWSLVLFAGIVVWAQILFDMSASVIEGVTGFDWSISFGEKDAEPVNLPGAVEVVAAIPGMLVALIVSVLVWYGIVALLAPGVIFHELGHYIAFRRANIDVESYGVLLFGPVPIGAFVESENMEGIAYPQEARVWAGGIANSMLYASLLAIIGVALIDTPISIGLFALALFELINCGFNTFPFGKVDGGGFMRAFESEQWGIDRSARPDERVTELLGIPFPFTGAGE